MRNKIKTKTRSDLVQALHTNIGLSRSASAEILESLIDTVSDELSKGNMVKIPKFGIFKVTQKGKRMGRNPKTGTEAAIEPRRVVTFRPSPHLRNLTDDSHQKRATKVD